MTQEEFDRITSMYSTGCKTYKRNIPMSERITAAQATAKVDEELKKENFGSVDTDGFEKAICLMRGWSEMILREMQKEKNFRIEINYNAEAMKTDICIYTPITEHGTKDNLPEHQES